MNGNQKKSWISVIPDIPSSRWVEFDPSISEVNKSDLRTTLPLLNLRRAISFRAIGVSPKKILGLNVIPITGGSLIVSEKVQKRLIDICQEDFELLDVKIICKNELIDNFKLLHPLMEIACTDFSRSKIDWTIPDVFFGHWDTWYFLQNALHGHDIVREKHTNKTVVSDRLKNILTEVAPMETKFVQPEDYANL